MWKRVVYGLAILLLAVMVTLLVWQGSFSFGAFMPTSPEQTYAVWAVFTLIFVLTIALGFMLFRNFLKLYVEHRQNREGSRIRTKLVLGAIVLSMVPVIFLVLFSITILSYTLTKWFTRPADAIKDSYISLGQSMGRESRAKALAYVELFSQDPNVVSALPGYLQKTCSERGIDEVDYQRSDGSAIQLCRPFRRPGEQPKSDEIRVQADVPAGGRLVLKTRLPLDLAQIQSQIDASIQRYNQLTTDRHSIRKSYLQLLTLISLFVLFFATWIALFFAKQISVPISALCEAARQVRNGNLSHRIQTGASDEFATLVRSFNEMAQDLETSGRELENRRRFTEAILESIPTGVISCSSDGRIQKVNRALKGIFSAEQIDRAIRLDHLFSGDDLSEIRYLMNRARRVGIAASQMELKVKNEVLHLSVTVSALDDKLSSGFAIVLEDSSDLLRAQKAAAWHEVARRVAHEIKNPLTPIALCAERMARYLERGPTADAKRVLQECSATISAEVESVKNLVDEFAQFARFPSAQPVPSDLNEVVENALTVFNGRLDGIEVRKRLAPELPLVNIDREQFKRVVINLVDNAAEAMQSAPVKGLLIATSAPTSESIELTIADTGSGISAEDKEKLFLPYFSTKKRGTGLGLAIVSHILSDHNANIRIEDNEPSGARFIIEVATLTGAEADLAHAESPA